MPPESQASRELSIEEICEKGRKELLVLGDLIFTVNKIHSSFRGEQQNVGQHEEMHANFMLAYRHIEDARMRLGKVMQAKDGGKSVYPK